MCSLTTWCKRWGLALAFALTLGAGEAAAQAGGFGDPYEGVSFSIAGGANLASGTPYFVVADFSDFQCPYSRKFAHEILPSLYSQYLTTGRLRYVHLDFPLHSIHPQALEASYAAHCAGDQGHYWEMHDLLYLRQSEQKRRPWMEFAQSLGIDAHSFHSCMTSQRYRPVVINGLTAGQSIGIRGTPTVVLGTMQPDGQSVRAGVIIRGLLRYDDFKRVLDTWLARQES